MKISTIFAACLVMICQTSNAQTTNKPTAALSHASQTAEDVKHTVLNIDYGLGHVLMSEQPTIYAVQLPVGGGSSFKEYPAPDVAGMGLQVWLLRADGTTIPQRGKPAQIGIGNAGWDNLFMIYTFDRGVSNELAGIVVRAKGKLYCQEIGADKK
jgi:hypothetical protein